MFFPPFSLTSLRPSVADSPRIRAGRMIAAQLLAYYFTELKDDQVKKVSDYNTFTVLFPLEWVSFARVDAADSHGHWLMVDAICISICLWDI